MKSPSLLLVLAASILTSASAWAAKDEGKIVSVSATAITVGKKHAQTYKITPATTIMVNGQTGTVTALKTGMAAEVESKDGAATSITASENAGAAFDKPSDKPKKNKK